MKIYSLSALFLLAACTQNIAPKSFHRERPHLLPDASFLEYRQALALEGIKKDVDPSDPVDSQTVSRAIALGERLYEWINHLNRFREEGDKISLTSGSTQRGIPVESPFEYNEEIVVARYDSLLAELPEALKKVLQNEESFTDEIPIQEEEFLEWGRKTAGVYSVAARWRMMEPYLFQLSMRKYLDIRGYYFLSQIEHLEQELSQWSELDSSRRNQLAEWLIGICQNSRSTFSSCREQLQEEISSSGNPINFYQSYIGEAQNIYNQFFRIRNARRDVSWDRLDPRHAVIPFKRPETLKITAFIRDNIEDEWRFEDWKLRLDFRSIGTNNPYVRFVPGVTPNVNGLGGNRITMDANQPLDEYNTQWTIRHEFGHVLGFPDCYVEFYDSSEELIINYQIDIDNLMCSRRGKMNQTIFQEMKRVYYRDLH